MARIYGIGSHENKEITEGWRLVGVAAGAAKDPAALAALVPAWRAALVPGTVASAERAQKTWSLASPRNDDACDWWYQVELVFEPAPAGERRSLQFDGLASVAEVWLDEKQILASDNMFVAHQVDITPFAAGPHQLSVRFRSLDALLKGKRPRPRWRTRLVEQQNLRAFRTTLIGRVPAFTPKVTAVGPYLPITLKRELRLSVHDADVRAQLIGQSGLVQVSLLIELRGAEAPLGGRLVVGEFDGALVCEAVAGGAAAGGAVAGEVVAGEVVAGEVVAGEVVAGEVVAGEVVAGGAVAGEAVAGEATAGAIVRVTGSLELPDVARWWPHTHGAQPRYRASISLQLLSGAVEIDLGQLAFRQIEVTSDDGGFALSVNGEAVFCRGACWTTSDVVTLIGNEATYRASLELAREAGMNMLRIAGTNAYEHDVFYELCDELGILVWQDFMFANMDYPNDEPFLASVRREVDQFVSRTQTRVCLAVLCGGSEVEQQVAMLGLPRELWRIPLFREHIPEVCRARRPDVPYCSSSPTGGALPFHVNNGVAHYYGVGAYLRPLEDARRAEVRFASECLAFANIPEEATLETFLAGGVSTPQNVRWKERAPRDSGGSWDFDDVRDHYLERLFRVDARELRTTDLERYLALGRAVTGEVMANVFGEWRRKRSTCRGGLVFAFQDFWPGAGFGVVDSLGQPKAAYYYLKRALGKVALFASDEGSNGVVLHAINDTAESITAQLVVELYRHGQVLVTRIERVWALAPRSANERALDQELEHFVDSAYSYRFGPPSYDVLVARLERIHVPLLEAPAPMQLEPPAPQLEAPAPPQLEAPAPPLAEAYFFPAGMALARQPDIGLRAVARKRGPGQYELTLTTGGFAQAVCIDAPGYTAADNWFHLAPGACRTVQLSAAQPATSLSATLHALNTYAASRVTVSDG